METIRNYIDNMFAGLPKTARVDDLKNNILSNMEEKYNELKSQGKSENEAIGIVISEFGNIDELIHELGLRKEESDPSIPLVTAEEVETYLTVKRTMGVQIGLGVFLCILSPAMLLLLSNIMGNLNIFSGDADNGSIIGLIILFIFVAIAVAIFIFSGMNFDRYKYMENGVRLPSSVEADLKQRYDSYTPVFYRNLILGVCMIVLSPIAIFVTSMLNDVADEIGVVILLCIVATSVFLFITSGTIRESFERMLQIRDYTPAKKKEDKVIGAVASIVWPIAVVIFLISGLVYNKWNICWIIFPVTGILFGMFSAAYGIITGKNEG